MRQAKNGDSIMRTIRYWVAAPLLAGAAAAVLAACGSSSPSSTGPSTPSSSAPSSTGTSSASSAVIGTRSTGIGTVLVNAQGRTLYWFAKDTPTTSNCSGTCATYWPPVLGKPKAASGSSLPMALGTIKRAGGQVQATYDGHPLYTYVSDTSAGMTGGNGLNLSGGLWWAMTPSGSKPAAAPSSSSSSSSSGYGGGY
jgi:predicted lipoprotein with Yx(FWY)xxD motif